MKLGKLLAMGALLCAGQMAWASGGEQRVVSFDFGSLDTLEALGLSAQVVGVPKSGLPAYLHQFAAERYRDVGNLKAPDAEAVAQTAPTLILVTGRQGEAADSLHAYGVVRNVGLQNGDYWPALQSKVLGLATYLDAEQAGREALAVLQRQIESNRQRVTGAPSVLVVTHNNGNFSLRNEPVVSELLQLSAPALPVGVTSQTRGTRTFTPLSVENMARMAPDLLLVVDRSAAIGNTEQALDATAFTASLQQAGAGESRVKVLSPALWYLSGAGLTSVRLQMEEVIDAL